MSRSAYVLNATSISKARSSWIQSKSHKCSIPFGKVVPLGIPVMTLPGDSWKCELASIIRMLTPKAPLMDSISGDVYAYFVPNRLVFDRSKEFFGQNESAAWTLNLNYTIPHIGLKISQQAYTQNGTTGNYYMLSDGHDGRGTLLDHFETPFVYLNTAQFNSLPVSSSGQATCSINALPFRAYQLIWNEDFRNPAVCDCALRFNYDHSDIVVSRNEIDTKFGLLPVMRYRDLFTSALKSPQRGPSVTLPLGTIAPLVALPTNTSSDTNKYQLGFADNPVVIGNNKIGTYSSDGVLATSGGEAGINQQQTQPDDNILWTNVYTDLSSASAATVNTIRNSIALQHLYEMMTNAFRYQEYTQVFFGVRGADATLQRPQHLGGIHFRFNVNQVVSTSSTSGADLGQTGAFGTAEMKGHIYTQSFTEHGQIMLLIVLRKEHTYVQGLDKFWRYRDFLDYFQPPLQHSGNVDIKNSEIFFQFTSDGVIDDEAFGYTEPYYEYRYMTSKACGLMNPLAPGSLSFYSLTDVLSSKPSLNQNFVSEDPNGLDNALIASASVVDQFYGDFYIRYRCHRVMDLYSIPGLNRI